MPAKGFNSSDTQLFRAGSVVAQPLGFWLFLQDKELWWFPVAYWSQPRLPGLSFKDPLSVSFMVLSTAVCRRSHWKHLGLFKAKSNCSWSLALPRFLALKAPQLMDQPLTHSCASKLRLECSPWPLASSPRAQ